MKDNEYYRPAESGMGTEEPSAVRDEFARPKAAPARPTGRRRQHGRLLQLLCGAAAVTVIAQAALPAGPASAATELPLFWEEVTLLGMPISELTPGDLAAAYGMGNEQSEWKQNGVPELSTVPASDSVNVRQNKRSYRQKNEEGYSIELYLSETRRYYSQNGPNAGESYYTQDRNLRITDPACAPEIRGVVIGMDVQEALERVGFSKPVWNLLTDLAPKYGEPDPALVQAFDKNRASVLEEYGIPNLRTPYYLGGLEYTARTYGIKGQETNGPGHDDVWQITGEAPYHGTWIVRFLYDYHNRYDRNGDYVCSVNAAGRDCNGVALVFQDGVLTEIDLHAVGAPKETDPVPEAEPEQAQEPEPAPAQEEMKRDVPSVIVLPDILRWEEITIAGIPFDRLTPEDVAACYPGGVISARTAFENGTSYFYEKRDAGITFVLSDFSDGSHGRSLVRVMYYDLTQPYPDPEFRGLKIGMTVDEVLSRIGIPEEKWELLGIDKQQGYAMRSKEVFYEDNTEKPYCHVRINSAWENEREL